MSVFDAIGEALGIIDKAVPDADLKEKLIGTLSQAREDTYRLELQTKTVPWVDALHKMGRQLLSWGTLAAGVYLLAKHPDVNPMALASIIAPGGVYNFIKGKGQ